MTKKQIMAALDHELQNRWDELDNGASEQFEGEMTRIEREQDDRHFKTQRLTTGW